ncbi:MAG: transporter substrate-binding domain-containing protein, partial [Bacteroidota bacterium]
MFLFHSKKIKYYLCAALFSFAFIATAQTRDTIQGAWYRWVPYQYVNEQGNLNGLDYALVSHIFKNVGIKVQFDPKEVDSWQQNQEDVLYGKKDVTGGAFWTEERNKKYLISEPYRYEWNTLYIQKNEKVLSKISNIDSLLNYIRVNKLKIGVVSGYTYTSPEVNKFVKAYGKQSELIVKSITEEENFDQLINNRVNIIIADRITGAQVIWKNKDVWTTNVTEHALQLPKKPIHLLIHKGKDSIGNVKSNNLLAKFNESLKVSRKKGELEGLIANYLFPVLMNITVQTTWFQLVDYIGAIFFAIAGFLLARESRFDIFGTIVMVALLTSGGGIMRDILVSKTPSFLVDVTYVYIIMIVSILGFLLMSLHSYFIKRSKKYHTFSNRYGKQSILLRVLIESIALGAYTIIGVGVAVEMNLRPLWLWGPLLGVITSSGGGILAGALKKNSTSASLIGGIDPEISILGGISFSLFLVWQINRLNPNEVFIGVLVTIIVMAVILYLFFLLKIKSPVLKLDEEIIRKDTHEENN